jgi:hypothetical protein
MHTRQYFAPEAERNDYLLPRRSKPRAVERLARSDQNGFAGTGQSRLCSGQPLLTRPMTEMYQTPLPEHIFLELLALE